MKLYLDLGNTRIKWFLVVKGDRFSGACLYSGAQQEFKRIVEIVGRIGCDEAVSLQNEKASGLELFFASVVDSERTRVVVSQLKSVLVVSSLVEARVQRELLGLTVCYPELDRLGVDRWLSMIAAYRCIKDSVVVISAGSAITIDYISKAGIHLGGLIVPGKSMMMHALIDNTHAINVEALTIPRLWNPGCDTVDCVQNGFSALFRGLLAEALGCVGRGSGTDTFKNFDEPSCVYVCGGDAEEVCGIVESLIEKKAVISAPLLVLEGMEAWAESLVLDSN